MFNLTCLTCIPLRFWQVQTTHNRVVRVGTRSVADGIGLFAVYPFVGGTSADCNTVALLFFQSDTLAPVSKCICSGQYCK